MLSYFNHFVTCESCCQKYVTPMTSPQAAQYNVRFVIGFLISNPLFAYNKQLLYISLVKEPNSSDNLSLHFFFIPCYRSILIYLFQALFCCNLFTISRILLVY